MIILAIDTCGFFYSLAILRDNQVLCEIRANEKNMQCEELVSQIELLLAKATIDYSDLDLLAVTTGPGTFNGVRIGMSAAYGISLASGIKIATVSTLEVIAYKMKATSVCFAADSQIGFLQQFDSQFNPTSEIVEIILDQTDKNNLLLFDVNNYDLSDISNAVSVGLLYINRGSNQPQLFYGKLPSIHVKNPD